MTASPSWSRRICSTACRACATASPCSRTARSCSSAPWRNSGAGTRRRFCRRGRGEARAGRAGASDSRRALGGTTGPDRIRLLADRDVRPEAAAAVVGAGGRLTRLSVEEPSLEVIYTRYFENQGSTMRREGSPWRGVGVVFLKELSDHLTSARMRVLEGLVVLTALAAVYGAIQQLRRAREKTRSCSCGCSPPRASNILRSSHSSPSWSR